MSEPTSEAADAPVWQRRLVLADTDQMLAFGTRLARLVRAGDLIVLTGDLGAGKTTLVKGLGAGLDVRGRISSPTFIIARTHAPTGDGPALVHVDAYRLQGLAEVDDLDLDTAMEQAVTVVEWGAGLVEDLAADHLEVTIERDRGARGDVGEQPRQVTLSAYGPRWARQALDDVPGPGGVAMPEDGAGPDRGVEPGAVAGPAGGAEPDPVTGPDGVVEPADVTGPDAVVEPDGVTGPKQENSDHTDTDRTADGEQ